MKRPCECGRAAVGEWVVGMCRVCWHALNTPAYRALWGIEHASDQVDAAIYAARDCCGGTPDQ